MYPRRRFKRKLFWGLLFVIIPILVLSCSSKKGGGDESVGSRKAPGSGQDGTAPTTEIKIIHNDSGEQELLVLNNKNGVILGYEDGSIDTIKPGVKHFTPKEFVFRVKALSGDPDTILISRPAE